jgi:hypothetical protein
VNPGPIVRRTFASRKWGPSPIGYAGGSPRKVPPAREQRERRDDDTALGDGNANTATVRTIVGTMRHAAAATAPDNGRPRRGADAIPAATGQMISAADARTIASVSRA